VRMADIDQVRGWMAGGHAPVVKSKDAYQDGVRGRSEAHDRRARRNPAEGLALYFAAKCRRSAFTA
jgi:hypothetical protein